MSTVLVIDDDLGTLEGFSYVLRSAGFSVVTAASVRDAVATLESAHCDLILSDLHLPDGSGLDILRHVRRARVEVPFVMISGFGSIASAVDAIQLGAINFVEKPLSDDELIRVVESAFARVTSIDC